MFYSHSLTIPANTSADTPEEYDLQVTHGLLHRIEVEFPRGCAGLVHLVIEHWESQLYPSNPDGDFSTDGYTIAFDDYFELYHSPYLLRLVGWNEDDTYSHTVTVRVGILPPAAMAKAEESWSLLRKLAKLVGIK